MKITNANVENMIIPRETIPEWAKASSIVLVYPRGIDGRNKLENFYKKFINSLPEDLKITLIVKSTEVEELVKKLFHHRKVETIIFQEVSDIWIKDWAPVLVLHKGNICTVKFKYDPSYFKESDKKYAQADNQVGIELSDKLNVPPLLEIGYTWDLGNLTHNGGGLAIISNRLIADNENRPIKYMCDILHVTLGFSDIIFVPVEPGDKTGHVDGMVRFINERTLVVAQYPSGYTYSVFMDLLQERLQVDLGPDFKIIRLKNAEPEERIKEGIDSAVGNHMNFLRIDNQIYFPYYSDEISEEAYNEFAQALQIIDSKIQIIPVKIPEINDLASLGGVLNCFSWMLMR
jgi:agmatine deiminase